MGFDFNSINELDKDILGVNKKDDAYTSFFIDVAKFFTAIAMDNTNGLYVNIENIKGKLYASVHFKSFTEGYEDLNRRISLSDDSIINRKRFADVVSDVMSYLEDTFQCAYDGKSDKVDTIFLSTLTKLSKKKQYLDIVNSEDFFEYCRLISYGNISNIMYEHNQIVGADNDSNLNLALCSSISNYFSVNNYENLNDVNTIDYYNDFFRKLYNILHTSSCTKNNYLTDYIIYGTDTDYWVSKSIAQHLFVTKCNYNEILSIGDVIMTVVDGVLARLEFSHYDDCQIINIATNVQFNDDTLKIFEENGMRFKSCNFNHRNGEEDEMSIIFDLPPIEKVLEEYRGLEDGLVLMY